MVKALRSCDKSLWALRLWRDALFDSYRKYFLYVV